MPTLAEIPAPPAAIGYDGVGRRYVQAALYSGVGGVTSRVFLGLAPVVLARYMGPRDYGVYALVLSLVGIVACVSQLGQNAAIQKFLPEYLIRDRARGGAILANTLILTLGALTIVCAGFFLLSGWIASAIYGDPSLKGAFRFSALLVLSMSLFNLASCVVAGLQDFKTYSWAMIVRSAAFLGFGWAGVLLLGLYGALAGQLMAGFLGLALLAASAVRLARERFPGAIRVVFSRSVLGEIFSFSFPALLAGLLVAPAYWWANTLLARHAGFEQVGLFGVAFALSQLIMLIPSSLSIPAVSFMSEMRAASGIGQFSKLVSTNLRLMWALTLPLCLGCALASKLVVRICFGERYSGAAELVLWTSSTALWIVISSQIAAAIASLGRMWEGFALNSIWLLIFLGLTFWWVREHGGYGLAGAYFVSYLIFGVIVWQYSERWLKIRYEGVRGMALLTLGAVGVAYVAGSRLGTASSCVMGGIVSLLLILAEWKWVLDNNERNLVKRAVPWLPLKA